ncbi:hypothetical protein PV10_07428 [Exophiala mesophila]|uniref:Zn(2)-C6 fungal-type domain-containing protein n=1 Tax=Exophiala mesophila TaxID=212818 RepID=A0A0D1XPQ7_EXOME|nr:uncharacterized protein PV10_07428 [Exophiala mesophila]KIV90086.1 hypothetical protein PV10_07428 [Exophiala mesophila]
MSKRMACDRCYRFKERCHFQGYEKKCRLCERSGSSCTRQRQLSRRGRRPKIEHFGPDGSVQVWEVIKADACTKTEGVSPAIPHTRRSPTGSVSSIWDAGSPLMISWPNPNSDIFQDNPEEIFQDSPRLVKGFYLTYNMFMIGPTFAPQFRASIRESHICSPALQRDISIALFALCKRARFCSGSFGPMQVAQGTASLQKLRISQIDGTQSAFAMLFFGQAVATFDYMTVCSGSSMIRRYTLSSIQPWYEDLSRKAIFDPVTISPIFWDTMSCLVQREIPVIKFRPRRPRLIHHSAGLCTTLLPIFYDLCVVANKIKCQEQPPPGLADSSFQSLRQIEQKLVSWMPQVPQDFNSTYSRLERNAIMTQAAMYRSAGLLMVHRCLHPVGTGDDLATSYADAIMAEFSRYHEAAGPGAELHFVTFPILVASWELPALSKGVWESVAPLNMAPICSAKMHTLIDYVWKERRQGYSGLILDLVERGPDFVVLP